MNIFETLTAIPEQYEQTAEVRFSDPARSPEGGDLLTETVVHVPTGVRAGRLLTLLTQAGIFSKSL
jgi:hypothetical protein